MSGDSDKYDDEVEAFAQQQIGALVRYLRNMGVAEHHRRPVLNKALLILRRRWHDVRTYDRPDLWFRRVIRSKALDVIADERKRREKEVPHTELVEATAQEPNPIDRMIAREDVRRAIRALPLRQRQTIHLRKIDGFDVAETAEILGVAPGTVMSTTSDAMANLRRFLEDGYGPREGENR
jgi:RNA polymerase sigma factor (sigma-70 family)